MSFRERKLLRLDSQAIIEELIENYDDSEPKPLTLWKKLTKLKEENSFLILKNQNKIPVVKVSSNEKNNSYNIFIKIQNASNGNDDYFDLLTKKVELKQKTVTDETKPKDNSEKNFIHFKNLSIVANNKNYYENVINQNKNSFINITKIFDGRPENFYENKIKKILNYHNKISLSKRKSQVFQRNFKIFDELIDFAVDSCNRLYLLSKINDSKDAHVKMIDLKTGFLEIVPFEFQQPSKIEVSDFDIFVSDKKNEKNTIIVFSKEDYHKQQYFTDIKDNIIDFTVDSKNNLYVLTDSGKVICYSIIPEITNMKGDSRKSFGEHKNIYNFELKNAKFISVGRLDGKIYLLFPQNKENNLGFFDIKGEKIQFQKIEIDLEKITSFEVLNADSIFVAGKDSEGETKGQQISNSLLYDKISFSFSPDILVMNKHGDLFTTSRIKDKEDSSYEILSIYENKETLFKEARFLLRPLDSGERGTKWHRIKMEGEARADKTEVRISYFATDKEENIEIILKSLRREENNIQWSKFPKNPFDALFEAKGRYLWMYVTLKSFDGFNGPQISSISTYFPKISYLDYLPQIYQEDEKSKKFLENFLSLFEVEFDTIDEKIDSFGKILDVQATPSNFLPWIASWLGVNYQEGWTKQNLRNLLKRTPHLMKNRGTKESLKEILKIFLTENNKKSLKEDPKNRGRPFKEDTKEELDEKIWIFEHFQLKKIFANMRNDEEYKEQYQEYVKLYGTDPFSFFVLLDSSILNKDKLRIVHDIVEKEKPSHTVSHVCILRPWLVLGNHTYLGINSKLIDKRLTLDDLERSPLSENQSILDRSSIIQ